MFKKVCYLQVTYICEVLMRKQKKHRDITRWQEKFIVNYGKIQAWTEIRILTSAVGALHPNRRGHIQARERNANTASIIHLYFNVS